MHCHKNPICPRQISVSPLCRNQIIPYQMKQIQKKIERQYVLSDSSVNEYGFRLLTSGYQIDAFQKNPIGYYMHRREDGIVLKWEDLRIEDDKILGTPVINLSNGRGAQTCDEAENGFLNAASVGHIVVLEYSTDPEQMLPGQTGPTITKWYNKECSLVDIPGNCNALTRLYDAQENEINLVDLGIGTPVIKAINQNTIAELSGILQLADDVDEAVLVSEVKDLMAKAGSIELENKTLRNEKHALQQQLDGLNKARNQFEITALLDRALEDRKITVELRNKLTVDYATNPEGLKSLIAAMPAYRSIAEHLKGKQPDSTEAQWQWDDYEKNDPAGKKLKELRANDPVKYKELFDKKFAA
jgi:hypothetical protein